MYRKKYIYADLSKPNKNMFNKKKVLIHYKATHYNRKKTHLIFENLEKFEFIQLIKTFGTFAIIHTLSLLELFPQLNH